MKKLLLSFVLALASLSANAQFVTGDPCLAPSITKSSVVINISTATTTALVAPVTGSKVYICSFSLSIKQVVTTANTFKFVYGTGAACGTGTTDLTGTYGAGGVTAGIPIVVSSGQAGTIVIAPESNGVCATTTIGATANFNGVLTYIQQP